MTQLWDRTNMRENTFRRSMHWPKTIWLIKLVRFRSHWIRFKRKGTNSSKDRSKFLIDSQSLQNSEHFYWLVDKYWKWRKFKNLLRNSFFVYGNNMNQLSIIFPKRWYRVLIEYCEKSFRTWLIWPSGQNTASEVNYPSSSLVSAILWTKWWKEVPDFANFPNSESWGNREWAGGGTKKSKVVLIHV